MRLRPVLWALLLVGGFWYFTSSSRWDLAGLLRPVTRTGALWTAPDTAHSAGYSADEQNNIDIYKMANQAKGLLQITSFFKFNRDDQDASGFGGQKSSLHFAASGRQRLLAAAAAVLLLLPRPTTAQERFGGLTGTVTDTSGAVLPLQGVKVEDLEPGKATRVNGDTGELVPLTERDLNPYFKKPLQYQMPRQVRLGLRYEF